MQGAMRTVIGEASGRRTGKTRGGTRILAAEPLTVRRLAVGFGCEPGDRRIDQHPGDADRTWKLRQGIDRKPACIRDFVVARANLAGDVLSAWSFCTTP